MGLLTRFTHWLQRADATTLSNPAPWLFEALGASPSSSGITVTRDKALTYSAVWAAVNLISGSVASMPLHTHERTDTGKQRALGHPVYNALRYQANPEMSAFTFRRCLEAMRLLHGNGYAYIERSAGDLAMWPLDSLAVQVDRNRETRRLVYKVTTKDAGIVELDESEVFHVRGLSGDGIVGWSVLTAARNSIGGALARTEYSERFFANNATPNAIVKVPPTLSKDAKDEFIKRWQRDRSGLNNAHKIGLLTSDFEIQTLSINAKDSQLLESMDWSIRDVANWFNVPAGMIGDVSRSAYNALGQDQQLYLNMTLDPILSNYEHEFRRKLLTDAERANDSLVIEFERRALLQMEPEAQSRVFQTGINARYLLPNEVRAMLNLAPIDGGDEPVSQPAPTAPVVPDDKNNNPTGRPETPD